MQLFTLQNNSLQQHGSIINGQARDILHITCARRRYNPPTIYESGVAVAKAFRNLAKIEHGLSLGCAHTGPRCPDTRHNSTAMQDDSVEGNVLLCSRLANCSPSFDHRSKSDHRGHQQDRCSPVIKPRFSFSDSEPVPEACMPLRYLESRGLNTCDFFFLWKTGFHSECFKGDAFIVSCTSAANSSAFNDDAALGLLCYGKSAMFLPLAI